jgi:hypothetical protein
MSDKDMAYGGVVQGLGFVLLLPHAAEDAKNMRLAVGQMLVHLAAAAHAAERNWQVGSTIGGRRREARHG